MPPPPRIHTPNATIIMQNFLVNSKNDFEIWRKNFPLVCRARRDESIDI